MTFFTIRINRIAILSDMPMPLLPSTSSERPGRDRAVCAPPGGDNRVGCGREYWRPIHRRTVPMLY